MKIFDHFSKMSGPLLVDNYYEYAASVGLDGWLPMTVFSGMAAPIRHRGETVGIIWLGHGQEDKKFSEEDAETLVMFGSQAAMVIANARRYRDEQSAKNDLEILINTSPVGVVVFNAKTGDPLSFNREALRMVDELRTEGSPPESLLEIMTIRRADGREISLPDLSMAQVMSSGEMLQAEEVILEVPDGRSVTVLVNATPVLSPNKSIDRYVVTLQDMSSLEELERLRAEFLATVSHELRTPLATVRGSVSALLDESFDMHRAEMQQFHRIIFEQTDRMRALITDLLDVARIESGTLSISPEPTDLSALAREAGAALRIGGLAHNLRIEMTPGLPWVMADRSRILQVLGNLLNNAARNSPESSTIRMIAAPSDLSVTVSVTDEGRGIPAESLPHLFRKFARIESEEQGGDTGLGLAICRGIVEAHGGRIWAESDGLGLGASFSFTLPTAEETGFVSPGTAHRPSALPVRGPSKRQVRILAVDDDVQALKYIRDTLIKTGYAVLATGNPDDVPQLMEKEKPHLILLDLRLPGVDGTELMEFIITTYDVPVIFVSAYGQDQYVAKALEMGADDYVVKPFSPTELVARIRAALRRREKPEPSVPYVSGDLTIDYTERLVTLRGSPVALTAIQYRLLAELSINAGRVLTYKDILRRVWGSAGDGDVRPIRTAISSIRRELHDNADNPKYIFTELRVGYKMPKADTPGKKPPTTL